MSILTPTAIEGEVAWIGLVPPGAAGIEAMAAQAVEFDFAGPLGDRHRGETRPACARVARQYPRGAEIRNARQISIVSEEELAAIAAELRLDALPPAWLGATLMLRGVPELTRLPPASRLIAVEGPALVTDTENAPCQHPARIIEHHHPGAGRGFLAAARQRRGITAWVERPGRLAVGVRLGLHLPPRHPWPHG